MEGGVMRPDNWEEPYRDCDVYVFDSSMPLSWWQDFAPSLADDDAYCLENLLQCLAMMSYVIPVWCEPEDIVLPETGTEAVFTPRSDF